MKRLDEQALCHTGADCNRLRPRREMARAGAHLAINSNNDAARRIGYILAMGMRRLEDKTIDAVAQEDNQPEGIGDPHGPFGFKVCWLLLG